MAINIGDTVQSYGASLGNAQTFLNPADGSGKINSITIWIFDAAGRITVNWQVGIWYSTGGGNYKCRSMAWLPPQAAIGLQTIIADKDGAAFSLSVNAGDLIGYYIPFGKGSPSGNAGIGGHTIRQHNADVSFAVNTEWPFANWANATTALHGTGLPPAGVHGCSASKLMSAGAII